jgi:MFS family permease
MLLEYVFIAGLLVMSFSALGSGFVRAEIPLIILRAVQGLGKSLVNPLIISVSNSFQVPR